MPPPARLLIGDAPLDLEGLWSASADAVAVEIAEPARLRMAAARALIDQAAAADAPVYGLNTGLGANLGHRIAPDDIPAFQARLVAGRMAGVGPPLSERVGRAALIARLVGAAAGGAGLSPAVVEQMRAVLRAGLAPVAPSRGSIGAGDLLLSAEIGGTLLGLGRLWRAGAPTPAAEALSAEGLAPVALAAKDGIALVNSSCVTVALATEALVGARSSLERAMAVAALSFEGYGANPAIFDAAIHKARPAAGQEWAAAWFRSALEGGDLAAAGDARSIQDALSFRTMAPVFGAATAALERAVAEAEIELNAAADNPIALPARGRLLSTPNFHTGALALALDAARIGLAHVAAASAQRILKLMRGDLSGLPRFLSPVGGAAAGFMPTQKLAAALLFEVEAAAAPASLNAIAVSEMVEDIGPNSASAAQRLTAQLDAFERLTALEAVAAAQAVDLRERPKLGAKGQAIYAALREGGVGPLEDDRPLGADIETAVALLNGQTMRRS